MLKKINKGILIFLLVLFCFCLYRLFVFDEIYPYGLLLFGTFLSIGVYYSLLVINKKNSITYKILTFLSFGNLILLFSDYFYPELLRSTWNLSFTLLFALLIFALLNKLSTFSSKLGIFTYWLSFSSGVLFASALLFKISSPLFHSLIFYTLLINTGCVLVVFGTKIKKRKVVGE